MLPRFHALQLGAFGVITGAFGEPATWDTAPGGVPVAGFGLFKEPTGTEIISPHARATDGAEYEASQPVFEYPAGTFAGLKQSAARPMSGERLTIRGREFLVGAVKKKFDGETLVALLEEINPTAV